VPVNIFPNTIQRNRAIRRYTGLKEGTNENVVNKLRSIFTGADILKCKISSNYFVTSTFLSKTLNFPYKIHGVSQVILTVIISLKGTDELRFVMQTSCFLTSRN